MSWFNKTPEEKIIEEIRKENERKKRQEFIDGVGDFVAQNGTTIVGAIAFAGAVAGAVCKVVNTVTRYNTKKVEAQRRKQVYDRSTGTYMDLKRQLNSRDYENIGKLKGEGMKTGEALKKLNLIK